MLSSVLIPAHLAADTPTIAPTLNAAAFDMKTAKLYKSADDAIEILLPSGWTTPSTNRPGVYDIAYGEATSPSAFIEVRISKAVVLYKSIDSTGKADSPKSALEALITANSGGSIKFSTVQDAKIGVLKAQQLTASASSGSDTTPASEYDIRLAQIPNTDQVVYVQIYSLESLWKMAQPIMNKMLDSLVIHAQNIPTATPTMTLHPLLMSATALQKLIDALTPTSTRTPISSSAQGTTVTLFDGLQYIDTVVGKGREAVNGKTVQVKYTGKLTDGTIFDSTEKRSPGYFEFILGTGQVIKGWDEGVVGMKVGGKRTLIIPPELGYGAQGVGNIPANATLVFDIELVAVK